MADLCVAGCSCHVLSLPYHQGDGAQQTAGQGQVLRRAVWGSRPSSSQLLRLGPQTVPFAHLLLRRPVVAARHLNRPPWAIELSLGSQLGKRGIQSLPWQHTAVHRRLASYDQGAHIQGRPASDYHQNFPSARVSYRHPSVTPPTLSVTQSLAQPLSSQSVALNPRVTLFPSSTQETNNIRILT